MVSPFIRIVPVAVAALALVACSGPSAPPAASPSPSPAPIVTDAVLVPATADGTAHSYLPAAPVGARAHVEVTPGPTSTIAAVSLDGLLPRRGYAVHAHVRPCGPTGDAAGPHFQNHPDPAASPKKASSDPAFANPSNEFWFDLRTDAAGHGATTTTVPFGFADRAPASIVVHEKEVTATGPGQAGSAGGRVGCITAAFR